MKTVTNGGTAVVTVTVKNSAGFLGLIESHRKAILTTPFVFAAILVVLYVFAGSEFRRVIDFISPSHLLGR